MTEKTRAPLMLEEAWDRLCQAAIGFHAAYAACLREKYSLHVSWEPADHLAKEVDRLDSVIQMSKATRPVQDPTEPLW